MIDKINDNNLLNTQQSVLQETTATQGIANSALKNAYGNSAANLIDESDISQDAINLYQREQEINKYSSYLDDISEEEATTQVVSLMEQGVIDISDDELAESMFHDIALLNDLFAE